MRRPLSFTPGRPATLPRHANGAHRAPASVQAALVTALAASLLTGSLASAAEGQTIAGDYVCRKGCRATDAPPSIAIKGPLANCMSELGGIYIGKVLSRVSVFCFNMVGTLSSDGKTVLWSNGNVWERRPLLRRP